MKRVLIFIILTLCFILSSCQKSSSSSWLIGTWEETKMEFYASINDIQHSDSYEVGGVFFVFENDGTGRKFTERSNENYTYIYNDLTSSLHLQYEKGSEENLIIEIIDNDTFVDVHKATSTHDGITTSSERKVYYKRVR